MDGRTRVVIENVLPQIDGGRFPIKRVQGEAVIVEADVFSDGHDSLSCQLSYRRESDSAWHVVPMTPLVNDRWRAQFTVSALGWYRYTIEGWIDPLKTWRADLIKRLD